MKTSRRTFRLITLMAAMALGGCSERSADRDGETDATDAERLGARVDLTIGDVDGADAYTFGRISGLVEDTDGRIIVADGHAHEIRVFSPEGRLLFLFGGGGSGPGELRSPCCIAFDRDGRLWVRESGNNRFNLFVVGDTTAEYQASFRIEHGAANLWVPTTFDSDGNLVDVGAEPDPATGQIRTVRIHRDAAGDVIRRVAIDEPPDDSLSVHSVEHAADDGISRFFVHQPFGPRHLVAHSPTGDWARAVSSRYTVEWFHDRETSIERNAVGPRLSDAERRRGNDNIDAQVDQFGLSRGAVPFGVPDRKPPLQAIFFDREGRLWVQRSVPEGMPNEADVYDRNGDHVATVEWPPRIDLRTAGSVQDDSALGVLRNELAVPYVVRLRMVREPE